MLKSNIYFIILFLLLNHTYNLNLKLNLNLITKQAQWMQCTGENQTCSFSGTRIVRYGANGRYNYKEATGSIPCSNGALGDPINGVAKLCDAMSLQHTWIQCAGENQTCSFSGTRIVRYGANGSYNLQERSNSVACSNGVFGDPIGGVLKACQYREDQQEPEQSTWVKCANDGQTCYFSGPQIVRFGANGKYIYNEATNSFGCDGRVIGDPIFGVLKACDATNAVYTWVQCAGENQTCSFSGTRIVRYGANGSYNLQERSNSVACSNGVFGDPIGGVLKACQYRLEKILPTWIKCADEGQTCTFIGPQIVRFGANGKYIYNEATNSFGCDGRVIGDPIVGVFKACDATNAVYTWVQCAGENQTCSFSGTRIVRYGANGSYNLQERSNSVACSNGVFGDPIGGVFKACQYRLDISLIPVGQIVTLSDLPPITPLPKQVTLPNTTPIAESVCKNKGLGFSGKCLVETSKVGAYDYPDLAGGVFHNMFSPILSLVASKVNACVGDYTGKELSSNSDLAAIGCKVPLESTATFGVFGFYVSNVTCNVGTPQKLKGCLIFDDCGTVVVTVNGGMGQCAADFGSDGLAELVAPLTKALTQVSVGFSVQGRFMQSFTIACRVGNSVETKKITTRGHFNFGMGLTLPVDFIEINKKSLKDIFDLSATRQYMIDVGNVPGVVRRLIPLIISPSSNNAQEQLDSILRIGSEVTVTVSGSLVLKLAGLSEGFLTNLTLEIATSSFLITSGGPNANSGLNPGIYFYIRSDVVSSFGNILNKIYNQFGSILGLLHIPKITLPSLNTSLGIFIQTDSLGFQIEIPGITTIKCIYIYSSKTGSCQFGDTFFTAFIEGAKWVIKQVAHFFDDAGREILRFEKDAEKFAEKAANQIANDVSNAAQVAAVEAIKISNLVANEAVKTANTVGNGVVNAANTVGNGVVNAANAVANFFSGW